MNIDYLLLKSEYMTYEEAIRAEADNMKSNDALWFAFIKHIAICAGYTMVEADRDRGDSTEISSPYLLFEKDGKQKDLTLSEVNRFIESVTKHSCLSLEILFERGGC